MNPRAQEFDSFVDEYDRFLDLFDVPVWDRLTAQGVSGGRRALDVGCGHGRRCREFADHFDQVVGIDVSAPMVDHARANRPHDRVTYHARDLMDFADDEGFDLVFSSTMLHHVSNVEAALHRLKSLARPGGWVVLADCTAPRERVPGWTFRAGAVLDFPRDVPRYGLRQAAWLFRFRATGPWYEHLKSDRYLTPAQFDARYGAVFEDATFTGEGGFRTMFWQHGGC